MPEPLSEQDAFLLNVMLAGKPRAVRIDESTMRVYGLTEAGETMVELHPNCRDERYLKRVRELLASHAMDSPEGYPVHLRRWTRMGQFRAEVLPGLLLTGEPEAVVAVVHASALTDDLARLAWWCMPTADNARQMLMRETVSRGDMGPVLAAFLIDYLPFEEHGYAIIETVWLVLANGLADADTRQRLWARGMKERAYQAGFLAALPDEIPDPLPARDCGDATNRLADAGNPFATALRRALSGPGQRFLFAVQEVIANAMQQEVVNTTLNALAHYFQAVRPPGDPVYSVEEAAQRARSVMESRQPDALTEFLAADPNRAAELETIVTLASCGSSVTSPILTRTNAVGTLMRKKLEPVAGPLFAAIAVLRGK